MNKTGLVLEGGGMRGVFTAGILEYFLENHLHFKNIVGVSAGAFNATSYISKQLGRNKAVTVRYAEHPEYMSIKKFMRSGELFNMDLIFDKIPNKEDPFDYNTFYESDQAFYIGVTDCYTGETIYYEKNEIKEDLNLILRASSSLPMVAPVIKYDGRPFLDGGISDPIPIQQSIKLGNEKHIVILTQCEGYQKNPIKRGLWYFTRKYRDYPGLINIVKNRSIIYNDSLKFVEKLENEGKAFVFKPKHLQDVSRLERKKVRLQALYDHGYDQVKKRINELEKFLMD